MSELDLGAIRKRAEAAATGPWSCDSDAGGFRYAIPEADIFTDPDYGIPTQETMLFVQHAREDVLDLCAEVEKMQTLWAEMAALPWPKFWWRMTQTDTGRWRCDIDANGGDGPTFSGNAETLPQAILRAVQAVADTIHGKGGTL